MVRGKHALSKRLRSRGAVGCPRSDATHSGTFQRHLRAVTRACVFPLLIASGPLAGQTIRLAPPDAKSGEGFTTLTSIRELADGRVLVSDPRDGRLAVVDFKAGSVRTIGKRGSGPGEYVNPGPIRPLAGDSSIMIEPFSRRWLILLGDKIVATVPPELARLPFQALVAGVDSFGFVGLSLPPENAAGNPAAAREGAGRVVRWSRQNGSFVPVGETSPVEVPADPRATTAWSAYDKAFHTRGGWTAIVRASPYRVDWINPSGTRFLGKQIPYSRVRVNDEEKRAFMVSRAGGGKPQPPDSIKIWPVEVPPFNVAYPLIETWRGELAIPRTPTAAHPNLRYDLVDQAGRLRAQLEMPKGAYLLGFGRKVLYTVVRDEDDLMFIQRHVFGM